MPWDGPSKSFIRTNGRNVGTTIWQQDAAVAQPIDAPGHDVQDQDIAVGITACLNINGVNAMAANLDFGTTFKGVNLAAGTADTDAVNLKQLNDKVVFASFKSTGPIRQKLGQSTTIDVSEANRHRATNQGGVTLTFDLSSVIVDPDLGDTYHQEGTILIRNGAAPGTITLAGDAVGVTPVGAPNEATPNVDQVLTYIVQRVAGANNLTLIWSAP